MRIKAADFVLQKRMLLWLVYALCVTFVLAFVLRAAIDLVSYNWDWDIDHMMYYGSRLLQGELVWTLEYDDKLPLVQYIFAGVAYFKSIRFWQLLSVSLILVSAQNLYRFIENIVSDDETLVDSRLIASFSTALYLAQFAIAEGGVSHVNPLATSLFVIGMCSLLRCQSARRAVFPPVFPALMVVLAVSIRPYFLIASLLIYAWYLLRGMMDRSALLPVAAAAQSAVLWGGLLFLLGLTVNFAPYALTGKLGVVVDALQMLGQKAIPSSIPQTLDAGIKAVRENKFMLATYVGYALLLGFATPQIRDWYKNHQYRVLIDFLFVVCLLPLSVEILILKRHFWPHYLQMFAPFVAIGSGLALHAVLIRYVRDGHRDCCTSYVCAGLGLILVAWIVYALIYGLERNLRSLQSEREGVRFVQYESLLAYEGLGALRDRGFFFPESMYAHWQIGESRRGFPHAAHIGHIESGWWNSLLIPTSMRLPNNAGDYCNMLNAKNSIFIVTIEGSYTDKCLGQETQVSARERILLPSGEGSLVIYAPRP